MLETADRLNSLLVKTSFGGAVPDDTVIAKEADGAVVGGPVVASGGPEVSGVLEKDQLISEQFAPAVGARPETESVASVNSRYPNLEEESTDV